jgi:hypothetical protein
VWNDFQIIEPAVADDAVEFDLASNQSEEIRALVPRRELMIFTTSAEWAASGGRPGAILTPDSIAARRVSQHGSGLLAPVSVADSIFFVQQKGVVPRVMSPDANGNMRSIDASMLSRHLFEGYTVVDWAWSEDPFSTLWVVRSDGKLLSCTYIPEQSLLAWCQHDIGSDAKVKSVAVKPEATQDAVYLVVRRDKGIVGGTPRVQWSLERFAYRTFTDQRFGVFLDESVSYNGQNTTETVTVADGASNNGDIGETVQLQFSAAPTGVAVGVDVQIDDPSGGRPYRFRLTVDNGSENYDAVVLTRPLTVVGDDEVRSGTIIDVTHSDWWILATALGGLYYMPESVLVDGSYTNTITVVADGEVIEDVPVLGGGVDIEMFTDPGGAGIIHAGVGYNSDFESLDALRERGREKIISEVGVELEEAHGGYVGSRLTKLTPIRARRTEDDYATLATESRDEYVKVADQWGKKGRVAFRNSDPIPVTLLGVTRKIAYGGK